MNLSLGPAVSTSFSTRFINEVANDSLELEELFVVFRKAWTFVRKYYLVANEVIYLQQD